MTTENVKQQASACAELSLKYKSKGGEKVRITKSEAAADMFRTFYEEGTMELRECFYAMYLNRNMKVIGVIKISEGTTSACVVDVKFVLMGAVLLNASSVILCHNHPSGNLGLSQEDIALTKKVKAALLLIDVQLQDHVVLTEEFYKSFADEGIL